MAKHVLNDEQYQKLKDNENAVPPAAHNAAIAAMFRLGMWLGIGTGLCTGLVGFGIVLANYDLKSKPTISSGPGGYVLAPPATAPDTPGFGPGTVPVKPPPDPAPDEPAPPFRGGRVETIDPNSNKE